MDEPGYEPFACAGFALEKNRWETLTRRLARHQLAQFLSDDVDGRTLAEQVF